jgi:glucose/arabinose dehydrogenase
VNFSKLFILIIYLVLFSTIQSTITFFTFGENITSLKSKSNNSTGQTVERVFTKLENDRTRPSVNITYPEYPPTVTTGKIIIVGTANDSGSGIRNVSADVHTFPFKGHFPIPLASQPKPISPNNWSYWSFPLIINSTDSYRVVVTAIDNAGNANYAETTINTPIIEKNGSINNTVIKEPKPTIAFVRPTFTEAAYQEHGFYRFYFKYGFPPFGKNVTTDLDMLTVKLPKSVSEFPQNDIRNLTNITSLVPLNGTELSDVSQYDFPHPQKFWLPFIEHAKKAVPNAIVTAMRDEDVHDGHIFYDDNKTNAYDTLLLFHNEYVTQQEYDNLKQFVNNGGTIVFIDANALYAEVRYDRANHTITLAKGHDWEFDGKNARRSISERWHNETKQWVGSNFLVSDINNNMTFANNPFNYTHFEEQFVNNPKAKILIDYGIKFPIDYVKSYSEKEDLPPSIRPEKIRLEDVHVGTYTLDYGKGKVIMLGLTGRLLANNQKFMNFFDNTILPNTLCPKFQSCWYYPTTSYLYGCTTFEYVGLHCDPISNEFDDFQIKSNYTKVSSVTIKPNYTDTKFGKGIHTTGAHGLESLRANIIDAYDNKHFSVYVSFKPDQFDELLGNPYETLVSYKNGIYRNDAHDAGWLIELVPNNSNTTKKVHFTVFNSKGEVISTNDVEIPMEKFSNIVGTFDGRTVAIFVNGTLKSETPFTGTYNGQLNRNNFLKVSGDSYCSCYLASGVFDEIRYYNYTLNAEQVKLIHNQLNDILGKGLVGYWKFDGDLKDYSGNKNDMFYNTLVASMAFAPDGRLFYTEKNSGNIRIMVNNTLLEKPFASIPNIHVDWEQGLLGLAIDSKFKQNHFIYAYYNYKDNETGNIFARIVRFTDVNNKGVDEIVILDKIHASSSGFHTGGALAFNKVDDKLYATVGDAIDARQAQNLSSLNGKTLRMNRDGTIPDDNPFPNSYVYTYGHRNMYGIAFDERGNGLVTEPGSALYDEINSHIKGGNYGWRTLQRANMVPNPLINDSSIKPMRSYYISENPTQAVYYNGDRYPDLKGKFIVGSFRGDLFAYRISDDGKKILDEINLNTSSYPSLEVVATAVSPNGDIYFGAYDIFKLNREDLSSRKNIMYPVQINATNSKLFNVNYLQGAKNLAMDLIDKHGPSTISIKAPKVLMDGIPGSYECTMDSNFSKSNENNSEVHYNLTIDTIKNNSITKVQLQDEVPENLHFTFSTRMDNCSKTHSNIELD